MDPHNPCSLSDYLISTRHQAALVITSADVPQPDIAGHVAEQGNALTDQHGDARYGEIMDLSRTQKFLNGDAPIHVNMLGPTPAKLVHDLRRFSAHLFHSLPDSGEVQRTMAQNDDALLPVRPAWQFKNDLERVPPDQNRIHTSDELRVSMRLAPARRQEIILTVPARNEPVHTGSDEYRY